MRIFFIILLFFTFVESVFSEERSASHELYNFVSIEELNRQEMDYGSHYIDGYIVHVYSCPKCSEDFFCKPCMPDNIIVSKYNWPRLYDDLTDHEIIVFVDDASLFEVGEKYQILLNFLDVKTTNQPVNNVKLIYSKKIE